MTLEEVGLNNHLYDLLKMHITYNNTVLSDLKELNKLGYINDNGKITKQGIDICNMLSSESLNDKYVAKLQQCYPRGSKPGTTSKSWRGTSKDINNRLIKFFNMYPDVTQDEVIKATNYYVKHNSNSKYMRTLPYFIWKHQDGEYISDLYEMVIQLRESEDPSKGNNIISNSKYINDDDADEHLL